MDAKNLKNYLSGATEDSIEGWEPGQNRTTNLAAHDRRFHPRGYKDGDTCRLRSILAKSDESDHALPKGCATHFDKEKMGNVLKALSRRPYGENQPVDTIGRVRYWDALEDDDFIEADPKWQERMRKEAREEINAGRKSPEDAEREMEKAGRSHRAGRARDIGLAFTPPLSEGMKGLSDEEKENVMGVVFSRIPSADDGDGSVYDVDSDGNMSLRSKGKGGLVDLKKEMDALEKDGLAGTGLGVIVDGDSIEEDDGVTSCNARLYVKDSDVFKAFSDEAKAPPEEDEFDIYQDNAKKYLDIVGDLPEDEGVEEEEILEEE